MKVLFILVSFAAIVLGFEMFRAQIADTQCFVGMKDTEFCNNRKQDNFSPYTWVWDDSLEK